MVTLIRGALGSRVCCTAADNGIGAAGATAIAAALEKNTTVTSVNLERARECGSEAGGLDEGSGALGHAAAAAAPAPDSEGEGTRVPCARARALRLNGNTDKIGSRVCCIVADDLVGEE